MTTEKSTHGGYREGSGRKPVHGEPMNEGIYIRCSARQKAALVQYVEELSADRQDCDMPGITLSEWIRELALKHSGNEELIEG